MADRLTNFYVKYNIEDTTASADATFSTTSPQQYFTQISELKEVNNPLTFPNFTFEHNFNVLDGERTEMGNDSNNSWTARNYNYTSNTIIWVEDVDGTVVANSATSADHAASIYSRSFTLSAGEYYLSGCPLGGSETTYRLDVYNSSDTLLASDTGTGATFTLTGSTTVKVQCKIMADYFAEDVTFLPIVTTVAPPYMTQIVPYFNTLLSNSDGSYSTNPNVTITFSREHASFAFIARFLDNHPLEMRLTFYDLQNQLVDRYTVAIDSNEVTILQDVYGYAKIVIEFTKALPGHYIKFTSFLFGIWITWDETNVQNATVIQQIDRLSKNLSIDTLSFTVIDVGSELNLGNVKGMHKYFQTNQYLLPYEVITYQDGTQKTIELGKYYLKTFSESTNLGKMSAQSYLGLMDEVTFYGGEVYDGKRAGEVIEDIFMTMNFTNFTIDEETYDTLLYGTITPKSCRKALNEVLFACNSVINAHDLDNVIIEKSNDIRRSDILKDSKFSTSVTKKKYVYGVEVKYSSYTRNDEPKEIAKGSYLAGTYTIYFNEPHSVLSINTGTITEQSTYSVTFTIPEDADVVITGYSYTKTENVARYVQSKLKAGEGETIESYSTTLCNDVTAKALAKRIITYLNYDLTIKLKWLADDNDMGDRHVVENPVEIYNSYVGIFTKRSIDLTGGFIDTAEMAAQVIKENKYWYLRESDYELYAGDGGIL